MERTEVSDDTILCTGSAAKILGLTPDGVRHLERVGKLRAAMKTDRGHRLFLKADVDQLAARRDAERDAKRDVA